MNVIDGLRKPTRHSGTRLSIRSAADLSVDSTVQFASPSHDGVTLSDNAVPLGDGDTFTVESVRTPPSGDRCGVRLSPVDFRGNAPPTLRVSLLVFAEPKNYDYPVISDSNGHVTPGVHARLIDRTDLTESGIDQLSERNFEQGLSRQLADHTVLLKSDARGVPDSLTSVIGQ